MILTAILTRLLLILAVLSGAVIGGALLVGQGVPEGWLVTYARREPPGHWTLREVDEGRGVSRAILTQYTFPTEPEFSPDGSVITWSERDLNLLDVSTGTVAQLPDCYNLTWATDSTAFAYVCNGEMIVMERTDANTYVTAHRINSRRGDLSNPDWSPDGTQIAFQDYRDGFLQVFIAERDGSLVSRINQDVRAPEYEPVWSPDGSRLAFVSERDGDMEIYVLPIDTSEAMAYPINLPASSERAPMWSPDGTYLLFLSDQRYLFGELILIDMTTDTREPRPLDVIALIASPPRWSPDGKRIVFVSGEDGEIYSININGGGLRQLTNENTSHRLP